MSLPHVVLVGIHSSGKTTAARLLSRHGYLTHAEVGWAYRQNHLRTHPGAPTLGGGDLDDFDRGIFDIEVRRDSYLAREPHLPHCVETWHVGNYAYASVRSPHLLGEFRDTVVRQVDLFRPVIFHLTISKATFLARSSLPDVSSEALWRYYSAIEDQLTTLTNELPVRCIRVPNDGTALDLDDRIGEWIVGAAAPPSSANDT